MFKTFRDKNGDGKLDQTEMREWITPTGFDHAEAEANHLIHLADDDKVSATSIGPGISSLKISVSVAGRQAEQGRDSRSPRRFRRQPSDRLW